MSRIAKYRWGVLLLLASGHLVCWGSPVDPITAAAAVPGFEQRHHQLHGLSRSDLQQGADQLLGFMLRGQAPDGMQHDEYMSLVNDIYDRMLVEGIRPQSLLDLSLRVIPDANANGVWRDYCVQKLADTLHRTDLSTDRVQAGYALLDRLTSGAYPGMQGTGLIVACRLMDRDAGGPAATSVRRSIIGARAIGCAKHTDAPLIDRITALQVATRLRQSGTLGYALTLQAPESDEPVMLRVSALAAIGQLGFEDHFTILESHRLSVDIRMRKAARSAIEQIRRRRQPPPLTTNTQP